MNPESPSSSGCPKCNGQDVEVGNIATTGSGLSKMFDIQTEKFKTVTCTSCGYTELYADVNDRGMDLADVFFG